MFNLIFWGVIILLAWAFWPYALGLAVIWVGISMVKSKRVSDKERYLEALKLTREFEASNSKIETAKTLLSRERHCDMAISLLYKIQIIDPQAKALQDPEGTRTLLVAIRNTLGIKDCLAKAEKAEFKGQEGSAKRHYLEALFIIKKGIINDSQFILAGIVFPDNNKQVSKKAIRERAIALGWDKGKES